jgi:putative spermidine/putrescine transport system substrate-binding protein
MIAIWGSRIAPLVSEGEPVAFTFQQGLLNSACFAIPKGAKQVSAAQKMIAAMVSPPLQANIPKFLELYGPVNAKAFEARTFSAAEMSKINSAPANRQLQIVMDARFWGANLPRATEIYRNLMAP